MPVDPIVSAVVSSIIGSVAEGMITSPPPEPAAGIVRILPEETRKGVMTSPGFGQITIDGQMYPMSPGVQIRNEFNMMVMPTMISGPARIRYQVDWSGHVYRIWVLSATEARLPENR